MPIGSAVHGAIDTAVRAGVGGRAALAASRAVWQGVASAAIATTLYALSVVLQKRQAEQVDARGVQILASLVRRPGWVAAIGIQMIGLGFHSLALTRAPVALVQPIIASGVIFVLLFALLILGERPRARELVGTALLLGGMGLLVRELRGSAAIQAIVPHDLALALGSCAALIALLGNAVPSLAGRSGLDAVALATAAGLGQGMSDAMNRLLGAWLAPSGGWVPPRLMAGCAVVLLIGFGIQGLAAAQNALRAYRANTVVPCIVGMQLLVPIAMAQMVYGQDIDVASSLELGLAAFGIAAGLVTLCTSPRATASFATSA